MSIEMPAAEVYRLAHTVRGAVGDAEEIGVHLRGSHPVGAGLHAAAENFLESHRVAGRVLAGELAWLGDTVAAVADSWLQLDGALLARRGWMRTE